MAQSSKSGPDTADIEAQMKAIREDVAELSRLMKEAGDAKLGKLSASAKAEAERLVGESKETLEDIEKQVKQTASSVEDYVAKKPLQSALIALLVGLFIGSMSRR